jgi:hypothetical protein
MRNSDSDGLKAVQEIFSVFFHAPLLRLRAGTALAK